MDKPYVWKMIQEAVDSLGGGGSYSEIKNYISKHWPDTKENTINATIIAHTVNQPARVYYPKNGAPRTANTQFDIFYSVSPGQIVKYDPKIHGVWEIYKNEFDGLSVRQQQNSALEENVSNEEIESYFFALETHLRDFLMRNLDTINISGLKVFVDENGKDGREYPTDVGPIDLLLQDGHGNFIVVETKLMTGEDNAVGQLLRYMGWVKINLANDKAVKGLVVASKMNKKIKYAALIVPDILLYEYEMTFNLSKASL